MSSWKALNIESDDESDIEVDDTKELQIEEALKLYQSAVKFHAEGPVSFDKAAVAYQELFESEIFKYPESQSELRRIELYGPLFDENALWTDSLEVGTGPTVASGLDAGPSTLPQILHLSHKNYAQFKLEYLTVRSNSLSATLSHILAEASSALDHFVQALDKDDTDLDLWRRTAAVGSILDSKRVARFCLEAVLEDDEEGLTVVLSLPGLEEALASEQLRELVAQLDDRLSMLQSPLCTGSRRLLSKMLKQRLDAYPEVMERERHLLELEYMPGRQAKQPKRVVLKAPTTWAELGDSLLRQRMDEQHGSDMIAPASAISFDPSSIARLVSKSTKSPTEAVAFKPKVTEPSEALRMPTTIAQQFPGIDDGKPTTQPRIASADTSRSSVETSTITLPSRKRDNDAAGLQDGNDEGRTKSKRLRARDSTTADSGDSRQALIDANTRWEYEQQLNEFQAADDWMFETVGNLFEKVGIVGLQRAKSVRQEVNSLPDEPNSVNGDNVDKLHTAKTDIFTFLGNFNDRIAQAFTKQQGESLDMSQGSTSAGLTASFGSGSPSKVVAKAPQMPDVGLQGLLEHVNDTWSLTEDVTYTWVLALLLPDKTTMSASTYTLYQWPEDLKTMVVRTVVNFDHDICQRISEQLLVKHDAEEMGFVAGLTETIFELHLDIYTLIRQPNSGVDVETIQAQDIRLRRWAELAREAMHFRSIAVGAPSLEDELNMRFLWATTFSIAASDVGQDYVLECMNELRAVFAAAGNPVIRLQNNAVMPELSLAALDREISRLTTKDFFLKVTSQDVSNPIDVIEGLEPLLIALSHDDAALSDDDEAMEQPCENRGTTGVPPELVRFLQDSDISVRLPLWQRLRDAYSAIDHIPMVVFCYFRMMAMVLEHVKIPSTNTLPLSGRQVLVLKSLRMLHDMTMNVLTIIQNRDNALEFVDEAGLRSAVVCFGDILQLLQVFNVHEDSMRVGQTQQPLAANGLPLDSFKKMTRMLHDFQIYIWIVLYHLLQEAIYQNTDLYPTLVEDKFDFLRCVHRNLGIRGICGESNRIFVRLLKDEFVNMTHVEGYDSEHSQVLHDLYGLNCFLNPSYELMDHHCTHDAFIDRGAAMQAVDLLLSQASKLPIRELIKHPLEKTIERVHGVVPRKKPTESILRNRDVYRNYLRSPLNPLDMFDCLQGYGNELSVSPIPKEDAMLAAKGWHFLMGHISLTKFRAQKRTGPTATEDVDIAIAFFMQDLDDTMDKWETWFRLAQAYDTKIEESVVWSAEKLNNSMQDVVQLQRASIHCYIMATALAFRSADLHFETSEKMSELYSDFAMRLYSSSREPFDMLPFGVDDLEKFLSMRDGVVKCKLFAPLRLYVSWKLSRVLFRRALEGRPKSWTLHYMLGKCLWKMHSAPHDLRRRNRPPSASEVLQAFIRAIELLPDKRDSKEKREPILEPHYKLVVIVHKLVSRGELSLEQAREALNNTPYARTATYAQDKDEWVPHVLAVLKSLRAADKANWHHRMIARAAHIIYEDSDPRAVDEPSSGHLGAIGAKHELTQQMFTKTMVLQVWRPECERAGRHFVYTARYTRFFTQILEQLKDRSNLEALARRVRRRPHDVFEHGLVWQDICNAYLRLLRAYAQLPEGLETSTFSNIVHEDFLMRKEPLEKWMQAQDTGTSAALDVLREVHELKKVNQGLMKPGPIDDLIGDAYANLFNAVGKQLLEDETKRKQEAALKSPPRHPSMSLTHLMNLDGAHGESAAPSLTSNATPAQTDVPLRKKTGVGRREIRACAETCAQKAIAVSAAKSNAASGTRVQVVIETSAPGSIQDSADDESELSELEEEDDEDGEGGDDVPIKPMFPGLAPVEESSASSPNEEPAEEEQQADDEDVDVEGAQKPLRDIEESQGQP